MALAAIRRFTDRIRRTAAAPVAPAPPPHPPTPQAELSGAFRFADAPNLRRRLLELLAPGARVVMLDCSRVASMDGCGLAVLVEFLETCRAQGVRLRLMEPSARMRDAFALYGLGEALDALAERRNADVHDGVLVILEDDFPESIRLPAVGVHAAPEVIEEEDFADSIRLPATAA
ncbi:MAG: STAS domain-containing protein [Planctomycetes bacterium]|nr:STAS domain-containing protein [Planctomycetota bacterium]MCL4731220.1 STAS domain-containing protein [Planctomycetota bacterium]